MHLRPSYSELEQSLTHKQITVICGLRRSGKTTAIKYLLSKIDSNNKIFLDLEQIENRLLFNQQNYKDIKRGLEAEGIDFSQKAYIAIDEIQLVPNITSVIKYLYDNFDIKFLVTGSVSFYLKNQFTESLAGRKIVYEMFPLSFSEYLVFKDVKANLELFRNINIVIYSKYRAEYLEYIEFGGFPEVVLTNSPDQKKRMLKDIVNSYFRIDIKFLSDLSTSEDLYKLLMLLAARTGGKTDFSKLSIIAGIERRKLKEYIEFLEQTYMIVQVAPFVNNADKEIIQQKKLYFSDNGILNTFGRVSSGALLENAIAIQLLRSGKSLNYYSLKTGNEIDFVLDRDIAIEVKETATPQDVKYLARMSEAAGLKKQYVVSQNFNQSGFDNYIWAGSV